MASRHRLLITEFHHLGDAVLAFPFIRAAAKNYEVHFYCRPPVRDVAALVLPKEQVHVWEPPWHEDTKCPCSPTGLNNLREIVAEWRGHHFCAAVSVWADPRVQLLWALADIPLRIGFPATANNHYGSHLPMRAWKQRLAQGVAPLLSRLLCGRRMLTNPLHRNPHKRHQLHAWQQIAETLRLTWNHEPPWITRDLQRTPAALQSLKTNGRRILLAHVGARLPTKRWPETSWRNALAKLAESLAPDWEVTCMTGPNEPQLTDIPGVFCLPPPSTVQELSDHLAAADFVLAHDSFAAHLAHANGTQVLAIFGSGDPGWFSPGGEQKNAIAVNHCPWRPCLDVCRMKSRICLDELSTDSVVHAVLERLGRATEPPVVFAQPIHGTAFTTNSADQRRRK